MQAKPEAQLITERAKTTREFKQMQRVLLRHMKINTIYWKIKIKSTWRK